MGDVLVSKGLTVHESLSVATAHMESPSMVVYAHDPSAWEVETDGARDSSLGSQTKR